MNRMQQDDALAIIGALLVMPELNDDEKDPGQITLMRRAQDFINEMNTPECPEAAAVAERYRQAAKLEHEEEGTLEIDPDAVVSSSEGGAYVAAWVWVADEEEELSPPNCPSCDKPILPTESSVEDGGQELHAACFESEQDDAAQEEELPHIAVGVGFCDVCGHHGEDCTGKMAS